MAKATVSFISWNDSGRTRELGKAVGARLSVLELGAPAAIRHPVSALWTVWLLAVRRPRVVLLQNSFLLCLIVATYKTLRRDSILVINDCHTKSLKRQLDGALGQTFARLKFWAISQCDWLLIATPTMQPVADQYPVASMVVPDLIPHVEVVAVAAQPEAIPALVLIIGSFAQDEPLEAIALACARLPDVRFEFTGNPNSRAKALDLPSNASFLGFIEQQEFDAKLARADVVLALTEDHDCFLRSACEAIGAIKPLVTTDTLALRHFLGDAAVFVGLQPDIIADGIRQALAQRRELSAKASEQKKIIQENQEVTLQSLIRIIDSHH